MSFKGDVFPKDWINPKAASFYDLVVIGGGPGGMTAASVAVSLKAKVAIIEKEHFGGECLNVGCIPSKAFLRSSRLAAEMTCCKDFGLEIPGGFKVNFPLVMKRVKRLQSVISPHDSAKHFKELGCDVFLGKGYFLDHERIKVGDQVLRFKKAIIATGTKPLVPQVEGLEAAGYLTNQTVFDLKTLPSRLAVFGSGPIGCELAQAFARFGSQVYLFSRHSRILPREDLEASLRLQKVMEEEGVEICFNANLIRVEANGKEKTLYFKEGSKNISVDEILIAVGRSPAIEGLGLNDAGVVCDSKTGIATNEFLQTSNPNIYAVGDVTSRFKFTHISAELGKMAAQNALKGEKEKKSSFIVPWCTYTDPEIAHVGIQEATDALQETIMIEMKDVDRAILDGETTGFVKIHLLEGSDQIIGATIMARHAGDMISEIALAIGSKMGMKGLLQTIHSFPTQGEGVRDAAIAFMEKRAQKLPEPFKKAS